jgi:hypothetical protein
MWRVGTRDVCELFDRKRKFVTSDRHAAIAVGNPRRNGQAAASARRYYPSRLRVSMRDRRDQRSYGFVRESIDAIHENGSANEPRVQL